MSSFARPNELKVERVLTNDVEARPAVEKVEGGLAHSAPGIEDVGLVRAQNRGDGVLTGFKGVDQLED
jgi:hypothetical protein